MVTKQALLNALPIYKNEWVTVAGDQSVHDIISEVLRSHELFCGYYDRIEKYFTDKGPDALADQLYNFCKRYIHYQEESENEQTTSVPQGILSRGYGDCKHYAGFSAGIIDAKKRAGKISCNWCYRFASYNVLRTSPHHVFTVIKTGKDEIWIDPTPGSAGNEPVYFYDKKPKKMPLIRSIGSVSYGDVLPASARGVDVDSLQVANYGGVWYAWDKNGPIDFYKYGLGLRSVGAVLDTLQDMGINAATTAADAVVPGAGGVVQTAVNAILSLFKNSDKPAQQKIWQMFPISATPTASEVAMQINAALQHALSVTHSNKTGTDSPDYTRWDANWQDAYKQLFEKYTALYNSLTGKNYPVPPYYPPQAGYVFPGGSGATSIFNTGTGLPGASTAAGAFVQKNLFLLIVLGAGGYFLYKTIRKK